MCIAQNSCPNLLPSWSKLLGGGNRGQDVGCQLWSNWRRGRGDTQGKLPYACWQQPSQLLLALVGWEQSSQAPQLNWKPHHDEEEVIAKKKTTRCILFTSLGNTECIWCRNRHQSSRDQELRRQIFILEISGKQSTTSAGKYNLQHVLLWKVIVSQAWTLVKQMLVDS